MLGLDSTIEKDLRCAEFFSAIIIDLTETQSIDSTTLGLLAKLSILSRQKIGPLPTLVTTNPDITRLLHRWASSGVQYRRSSDSVPECLSDLPPQDQSEDVVRDKVLEAHRILMGLNESNREAFHDLVSALGAINRSILPEFC